MKKLIVLLVLLSATAFAQWGSAVRTTISYQERQIFNTKLDTVEFSSAVALDGREGIMSLAFDADTTALAGGATRSDSCLTVGFQLYFDNIGWSTYYNDRATFKGVTYTKIDTIARSLVAGQDLFMNVATATAADALADSIRFVFFIGVQDSTNLIVELRQE